MESGREFQAYMRAAIGEIEGSPGRCPTEAELVAYHQGQCNADAQEAIASHLTLCANCREVLLDIGHFLRAPHDDSKAAPDLDREWEAFAAAKDAAARPAAKVVPMQPRRERRVLLWAAAAAMVLATLSSVIWGLWTQRRIRNVESAWAG